MGKNAKREYLNAIRPRYKKADKAAKKAILDEFCRVCGYHRKYAIRLLNRRPDRGAPLAQRKKPGPKKRYHHPLILEVMQQLWRVLNLPCSRRLKAAIPLWLPYYEQHFKKALPDSIKQRLLSISPATIDRLMAPMRSKFNKLGLATTKPGSILKKHIPISTNQWDENRPGFLEADTVAHCGTSVGGMFVYTVNVVDLATGWTEPRRWRGNKEPCGVKATRGLKMPSRVLNKHYPFPSAALIVITAPNSSTGISIAICVSANIRCNTLVQDLIRRTITPI